MASLRRKPNSKYWIACFNLAGGVRVQRSTKTTDRRIAQNLADKYENAGRAEITESQARRIISDIHKRLTGRPLQALSSRNFLTKWLAARKGTVAAATLSEYQTAVNEFIKGLGTKADSNLVALESGDFAAFRDRIGANLSPRSANKKLKIMKVAMQQAWRDGLIESNCAARVQTLKILAETGGRRPFTVEEVQRIVDAASGEWKGLILLGFYTGQRLGDLARLPRNAIDRRVGTLALTTKKTNRRQILPLAEPLLRWLDTWNLEEDSEPLFPEAFRTVEKTGRVGNLSNQFRTILANAGLADKRSHRKSEGGAGRSAPRCKSELSFHSLRHSTTTHMKNAGISPALVQEFVGHDTKVISQNYTHIATDALRKAVKSLPDILLSVQS